MSKSNNDIKNQSKVALNHAKAIIHDDEVGDFFRTGRSSAQTKLDDVRAHDHGHQELAYKHIVHQKEPTDAKEAIKIEHRLEHVHEHRTLLSGFTL